MQELINTISNDDALNVLKQIPNNTFDLEILDPPYYKAIDEKWDKQWKTEEEYLQWSEQYIKECVRTLKSTGSLYIYGNFDILTKIKVLILDKLLCFRQNITLSKGLRAIAGRTSDKLRMFPTASEYLLFYVKQGDIGITTKDIENNNFFELRKYFKQLQIIIGLSKTEIVDKIGQQADHCFRYNSSQWDLPTEETYNSICKLIQDTKIIKTYIEIKEIFDNYRFTFNLPTGVTDVWNFIPDKIRYGHKTQKPADITERIIKASSNEGDLVFIPFAGSGSEIVKCIELNRSYIACETNKEYIDNIINIRISELKLIRL